MSQDRSPLAQLRPFAVVYDGGCPFCRRYVRLLRLSPSAGRAQLVDARRDPAIVEALRQAGHDVNCGIVVVEDGTIRSGEQAMTALARSSQRSGLFNRIHATVFSRPSLSRLLYPALRAARRATLTLLGRPPI